MHASTKYTHAHTPHTYNRQANVTEADRVHIVMRRYPSRCIIVQSATAAARTALPRACPPTRNDRATYAAMTRVYTFSPLLFCLSLRDSTEYKYLDSPPIVAAASSSTRKTRKRRRRRDRDSALPKRPPRASAERERSKGNPSRVLEILSRNPFARWVVASERANERADHRLRRRREMQNRPYVPRYRVRCMRPACSSCKRTRKRVRWFVLYARGGYGRRLENRK